LFHLASYTYKVNGYKVFLLILVLVYIISAYVDFRPPWRPSFIKIINGRKACIS